MYEGFSAEPYRVDKVRFHAGREGQGFNAILLRNGKAVAHILDEGNGGCIHKRWREGIDRTEEGALLDAHVKSLPKQRFPEKLGGDEYEADANTFLEFLIGEWGIRCMVVRAAKTKTCFILEWDAWGTFRILEMPYGPEAEKIIAERYGGKARILNPFAA